MTLTSIGGRWCVLGSVCRKVYRGMSRNTYPGPSSEDPTSHYVHVRKIRFGVINQGLVVYDMYFYSWSSLKNNENYPFLC